jgi:hypothetical protein
MWITLVAGLLASLLTSACIDSGITGTGTDEMNQGGGGGDTGGGDTGGSTGSGAQDTPRLGASIDKTTVTTQLGRTETFTVTLTSMDGFSGSVPVTLDPGSTMTGFTMTATPTSVDIPADGTATVQVAVKIPTDAELLTPTLEIDLGGTSPTMVTSDMTIEQKLLIDLPAGLGTGSHIGMLPTGAPLKVRSGTMVTFHNSDTARHRIHGDGGIPHESTTDTTSGTTGMDYTVTVTNDGDWYCHDHEDSNQVRLVNIVN